MATKQHQNGLIKCEHCGEYYSVTYRECPFCDEFDLEMEGTGIAPTRRSGGKRLVTNKKGGGYGSSWTPRRIMVTAASIGIIIAAFLIVFSIIKPLIDRGNIDVPDPDDISSPPPTESASPSPSVEPTTEPSPSVEPTPSAEPTPSVQPTPSIPADQTATGFTISHTDFSMSDRYPTPITIKVTFSPAGSTGHITWTSSDPDVAWVDANGKVSPGIKQGTATITATMAGGATQKCVVRSTVTNGTTPSSGPSVSPSPSASPSPSQSVTSFTLNKSDFTLFRRGETYRIKISGTDAAASWSSSNTSVATVSSDGTVTAVGNGTCTVTAKIGSVSQECIVRVSF